jgi:nicotinate phosphoribosyltransferase
MIAIEEQNNQNTERIINSMLDTDLYKFTMQQIVFHKFFNAQVEYAFKLRNYDDKILIDRINEIQEEVKYLCTLKFTEDELNYLKTLPYLTEDYIEFLRNFQLNYNDIKIYQENNKFFIKIKGNWLNTILFEVPVLAIISEIFSNRDKKRKQYLADVTRERLKLKIKLIQKTDIKFADFGTRRRLSVGWQEYMLNRLIKDVPKNIIGTSNVMFAKQFNITPIGTMAHEYIQAMQAIVNPLNSQKYAFEEWAQEYRGQLGIALSDTLGMNSFLQDFDLYFAKLYDGARQDSGDPFEWCDKLLNHYKKLGIDAKTKTAVFSDGLDFVKAIELHNTYCNRINVLFGIGTYLTNDAGNKAPQIVIKMSKCNGQPVAKISDSSGKLMCEDGNYLMYLKSIFGFERNIDLELVK